MKSPTSAVTCYGDRVNLVMSGRGVKILWVFLGEIPELDEDKF